MGSMSFEFTRYIDQSSYKNTEASGLVLGSAWKGLGSSSNYCSFTLAVSGLQFASELAMYCT